MSTLDWLADRYRFTSRRTDARHAITSYVVHRRTCRRIGANGRTDFDRIPAMKMAGLLNVRPCGHCQPEMAPVREYGRARVAAERVA